MNTRRAFLLLPSVRFHVAFRRFGLRRQPRVYARCLYRVMIGAGNFNRVVGDQQAGSRRRYHFQVFQYQSIQRFRSIGGQLPVQLAVDFTNTFITFSVNFSEIFIT